MAVVNDEARRRQNDRCGSCACGSGWQAGRQATAPMIAVVAEMVVAAAIIVVAGGSNPHSVGCGSIPISF